MCHELLDGIRLRILESPEIIKKCLNFKNDSLVPILPAKRKIFPVLRHFTSKLKLVLGIFQLIVSGKAFLVLTHSRPIETERFCFNLRLQQLSFKKAQKIVLLDNCFSDLFSEVEIWY